MAAMTKKAVRTWLLTQYLADSDATRREVECILSQDDWRFIDARADKFAGQAAEPGPAAFNEATGFALSALYECHGGPHLTSCPQFKPTECVSASDGWYCGVDQRWHAEIVGDRHEFVAPKGA